MHTDQLREFTRSWLLQPLLFLIISSTASLFCNSAKISFLKGGAYVEKGFEVRRARVGDRLSPVDVLRVLEDSQVSLVLSNGSFLKISEESRFQLADNSQNTLLTQILLQAGSLWCSVRESLRGERLEIKTPTATAGVRGTEFGVSFHPAKEETEVLVDEGEVSLRDLQGRRATLRAGGIFLIGKKRARRVLDQRRILLRRIKAEGIPDGIGKRALQEARKRVQKLKGRLQKLAPNMRGQGAEPDSKQNEMNRPGAEETREKMRKRLRDRRNKKSRFEEERKDRPKKEEREERKDQIKRESRELERKESRIEEKRRRDDQ